LALARQNIRSCVLEQAAEFSEIGAGLQLAPNATRVLGALGLIERVREFAVAPRRLVLMDALHEKELAALDLGEPFIARYGYPYLVMHRADLLNLLVEACRESGQVEMLTHKRVLEVRETANAAVAVCEDGSEYSGRCVVGADGLWSKTRRLFSEDEPICARYVAYRGTIPIEEIRQYARMDDVIMWIAPGLHFVQYPVRRGELYNQVAVFECTETYKPDSDDWGTPEELDKAYSVCCPVVRHAVTFMQRHRRWPMYDRLPIPRWTTERITLLGDAAHPMLQYIAQGACQAIEDALTLSYSLAKQGDDVPAALRAYEQVRTVRTARVQSAARTFGEIIHTHDRITALVRDTLLARIQPTDYDQVDWLYGHTVS
ncbi:MAG: FAD-dependent oxidoreductase, partial [Alicyclobacillus sp.]|nr:FAD-dependent oxidoreductase [Alicyclobacillus sp.]